MMKRLIYQTALIAYVNAICFSPPRIRPTCTKISEQFNRNIIYDSDNPYVSHDRLQRLLLLEGKWNKYIDGQTRFPIGFRIWNKHDKKTKIDLAMELLNEAKKIFKVKPSYVLMDSFYPAAKLLKLIRKFRWQWIAKIKSNRRVDSIQVQEFF
ncbi:MAG: transposase [Ignavibacteriaceae bacterium]